MVDCFHATEVKYCNRCFAMLPIDDFNRDRRQKDGRRQPCRKCRKARPVRAKKAERLKLGDLFWAYQVAGKFKGLMNRYSPPFKVKGFHNLYIDATDTNGWTRIFYYHTWQIKRA